ncbi:hypothetical protein [Yersinia frederiksenii]|uniref:hypothetical protein n=1 Tax=Yersinia frederiksenii TaxID=29484 RepID=UPI000AF0B28F|nr:hypothetical protein [Yersinia frederiksenii]
MPIVPLAPPPPDYRFWIPTLFRHSTTLPAQACIAAFAAAAISGEAAASKPPPSPAGIAIQVMAKLRKRTAD